MKLYSLGDIPYQPVSHDPSLKKQVMVGKTILPGIRHISHINLPAGSRASLHEHPDSSEVFYCIKGTVLFRVGGEEVHLAGGQCLIVEPGEPHGIEDTPEEAELVYLMVEKA